MNRNICINVVLIVKFAKKFIEFPKIFVGFQQDMSVIFKEREMKRQQTVILKQQEKERRKQHLMMIRALESQRKAEVHMPSFQLLFVVSRPLSYVTKEPGSSVIFIRF